MPIQNRNLEPGTKLIATYKKETYHALVAASADGKVLYQLSPYDGKDYKSPSSLGTAVTGKACNGWAFWSVDTDTATEETVEPDAPAETANTSTSEEPDDPIEGDVVETTYAPSEEEPPEPPVGSFRRVPNQRGVDEGQVRLYCDPCQKSFAAPIDQQPETCPEGHYPGEPSVA